MYTVRVMASYPTLGEALASPDVPRVIMVRNPYSRVLSAYMEKLEIRKEPSFAPKGYGRKQCTSLQQSTDYGVLRKRTPTVHSVQTHYMFIIHRLDSVLQLVLSFSYLRYAPWRRDATC